MKDELGKKIIKKLDGLRTKTYSYLIDDRSEDKKANRRKKCVINSYKLLNLRMKYTI